MAQPHRIGIVGMGHVGAHVANSLLLQGIADELYLCDVKDQKVVSETQDLMDSLSFVPHNTAVINVHDSYEDLASCDIIVNAAGNVALSAGNRDGELEFTTDACRSFAGRVAKAGFGGVWVTIANPCDVVATEIQKLTDCDPRRVIGSGTALDSARFRTVLARETGWDPKSIQAYMIGEHGDTMFACWSHVAFGGKPLAELEREQPERFSFDKDALEHTARRAGYVTYAGKGCTEYAVANTSARICAAVLHNEHAILAAGTMLTGQYGESGIYTSLPCVIGADGVEEVIELAFSERELESFHATCAKVRSNIAKLPWWNEA
ncbi:MAG: L-lactate dehydrogenase [Coriobacteriia bacterium]|nr:L-lactate dehydrogenase [Coriobacteriia bacterium]MBS5478701.1 L-lactate dehydrogenase [Coriobacteriia bacterium]